MTTGQDIVAALIESATYGYVPHKDRKAMTEAAAHIERLEAQLADQDRLLRASVPVPFKDATSPVGSVQGYIATLESHLAEARGEVDAIVAYLRKDAQMCDCAARSDSECACGAWDTELGERSYKRAYIEDIADAIAARAYREGEA